MLMLFSKLTLILIAAIISIASILVFIIPTDSIETQSLINNETQSVINSEKPSINHTLSIDQSISVSEANNRVAINLFKLLENDTQKNIFFSPFSILTAMTMEYEGARGNTALEMEKALGISFDDDARRLGLENITQSLTNETLDYELNVANALWVNDNFKVYPEYADTVNIHYDSIIDSFNSSSSDKINKWANDSTRGKIPEIVNDLILSDPSLAVIITNAVYFNASWVHKFPEYNTVKSDFWIDTKKSVDVDMMEQAIGQLHYAEIDGVQILKIPYKSDSNRLSMIIALPKDIDGIKDLENNLTYDMFIAWTRDTEPRNVQMHIPKFKITAKYGSDATIPAFQNLGIYDLFNPTRANLSGMSNDHLYVSDIFHDVFVNVDEIGIKAAAVTSIMNYKLDDHVIVYLDPVTFRADQISIWNDLFNPHYSKFVRHVK